jgi:hypothetical protein
MESRRDFVLASPPSWSMRTKGWKTLKKRAPEPEKVVCR